jgi:NTP pyrophosphatase (non-canonical NTP hydrolase)
MEQYMKINLNKYQDFVFEVTSNESKNTDAFIARVHQLGNVHQGNIEINPSLLLTAGIGLGCEAGEFAEIVKKMFFQGKPLNEENLYHMKRELGDIMWYWINACTALGLDPNTVIDENVRKLQARYPGGEFNAHLSENRKEGDL